MDNYSLNEYKVLMFVGQTNGSDLIPDFNLNELKSKYLTLKSLRFAFYAPPLSTMIQKTIYNDVIAPTQQWYEFLNQHSRLTNLLPESYTTGLKIKFNINDNNIFVFDPNQNWGMPFDLELKNINSIYPDKLNKISISVLTSVLRDYSNPAWDEVNLMVKVVLECYLTSWKPGLIGTKETKQDAATLRRF